MPDDRPWPRISIVTPSYNQGRFIEETIRSVLLQGYPDLEYIIIDGGSTDASAEIIRKYQPWLTYWVSEPDRGQSHAINRGFRRSTGEIIAWLNSDDTYCPSALASVAERYSKYSGYSFIYGALRIVDPYGRALKILAPEVTLPSLILRNDIPQPATFMQRSVLDSVGYLNESLHFAMDRDYWCRAVLQHPADLPFARLETILANQRQHADCKTCSQPLLFVDERLRLYDRLFGDAPRNSPIRIFRRRAYALAYVDMARLLYKQGRQWQQMLRTLAKAVLTAPGPAIGYLSGYLFGAFSRRIAARLSPASLFAAMSDPR